MPLVLLNSSTKKNNVYKHLDRIAITLGSIVGLNVILQDINLVFSIIASMFSSIWLGARMIECYTGGWIKAFLDRNFRNEDSKDNK